jgi:hypothetical protein
MNDSPQRRSIVTILLETRFLRTLAWAYGVASLLLWMVLIAQWFGGTQKIAGSIGPDFPAFYTGGYLARTGEYSNLYDFERQQELQRNWNINAHRDDISAWVHPPHSALLMAPFSYFHPRAAYAIYSVLLVACFALGLWILRRLCPELQKSRYNLLWILALVCPPVYYSINAGQNTGWMFLFHCATIAALASTQHARAGIYLAAGLLKPHLFLPQVAFVAAARRWKTVGVFAIFAILIVAISMAIFGPDVFAREWNALQSPLYQKYETEHAYKMFSWISFWKLLLGKNVFSTILGGIFALAVFARTIWLWSRADEKTDIALLGALSVATTVLVIPHLPVYDLALLLLPLLVILDRVLASPEKQRDLCLAMLALLFWMSLGDSWGETTRFQIVVPLLTWVWWRAQSLLQK